MTPASEYRRCTRYPASHSPTANGMRVEPIARRGAASEHSKVVPSQQTVHDPKYCHLTPLTSTPSHALKNHRLLAKSSIRGQTGAHSGRIQSAETGHQADQQAETPLGPPGNQRGEQAFRISLSGAPPAVPGSHPYSNNNGQKLCLIDVINPPG